jgi:cytochrome P450 family 307 subfamily A
LALCDWSKVQEIRREMLTPHTFPRKMSMSFDRFNNIVVDSYQQLSQNIHKDIANGKPVSIKPTLLAGCANIFTEYFTTRTFDTNDAGFLSMVKNFDRIFWEVNQGYAADFLPFLMPLHYNHMRQIEQWSHEIRKFILENIIQDRYATWTVGNEPNDYIESLIDHVKQNLEPQMDWETVRLE